MPVERRARVDVPQGGGVPRQPNQGGSHSRRAEKYLDEGNFVKAMWCGSQECELKVKELMQATIRIMPFDQTPIDDKCIADGSPAKKLVIFARAY